MSEPRVDFGIADQSVKKHPLATERNFPQAENFTFYIASVSDMFEPWGRDWIKRDQQLREFFPTESFLEGAVYSIMAANANFMWELEGPPRTAEAIRILLNTANRGLGWVNFAQCITLDLLTQDNGAFIELIRDKDSYTSPVIGIAHLDAGRCIRTGDPKEPVIYYDRNHQPKLLKWYQVIPLVECPSAIERMHGMQYCGLTRVLKMSQILRDIVTYKAEKVGGRFEKAIHIVGGPTQNDIKNIFKRDNERADNEGLTRFMMPTILASIDPEKPVSHVEIPLASMPENFDWDQELKWYLAALALGFGRDYQDLAPLPGGGLGTSTQSEILHQKSKAKGPMLFMRLLEYALNFYGIMPRSTTFYYEEIDPDEERQDAEVKQIRANTRKTMLESGEITIAVARQMASDDGDLDEAYLAMMGEEDVTPDATVEQNEPVDMGEDNVEEVETEPEEISLEDAPEMQPKFWGRVLSAGTLKNLLRKMVNGKDN